MSLEEREYIRKKCWKHFNSGILDKQLLAQLKTIDCKEFLFFYVLTLFSSAMIRLL